MFDSLIQAIALRKRIPAQKLQIKWGGTSSVRGGVPSGDHSSGSPVYDLVWVVLKSYWLYSS